MNKEEVFEKYNTNENGLNLNEVQNRIEKYGLNKLPEEKKKVFL